MALLSVAPNAKPPVFRIGEPEELIAGQAKKERDAKRRQLEQRRSTIMKEVWLVGLRCRGFAVENGCEGVTACKLHHAEASDVLYFMRRKYSLQEDHLEL